MMTWNVLGRTIEEPVVVLHLDAPALHLSFPKMQQCERAARYERPYEGHVLPVLG